MAINNKYKALKEETHEVKIHKIDYDQYAREAGEEAYRDAIADGLPESIARRFQEVFGAPIEPEFRLS